VIFQKAIITPGAGRINLSKGMAAKLQAIPLKTFTGHQSAVYALCSDGDVGFFSAGGDGMLVRWNLEEQDGVLVARIPDNVYCLAFDNLRHTLLAGTRKGELFVITDILSTTPIVKRFEAHVKGLYNLMVTDDGYVSSGGDGNILFWDRQFQVVEKINNSPESTRALCYDHEHNLWAGSSDNAIRIYNRDLQLQSIQYQHTSSIFSICALPSGRLISGGRDATLKVWENTQNHEGSIAAHLLHIHAIELQPSANWVATASMDKTVKIWDASSLELLKVLEASKLVFHRSSVNTLLWLDERLLVSAGDDRTIYLTEIT
jgi:WD40 repeat protein